MVEIAGLLTLLVFGVVIVGVAALVIGLIKLAFKLVLLPVFVGLALVKWVLLIGFGVVAAAVVGPVVVGLLALLAIPVVLIGGLIWAGVSLLA